MPLNTCIQTPTLSPTSCETVVLVHGLAATRAMLRPLERDLQHRGYRTYNWGYASLSGDIQTLSNSLASELQELDASSEIGKFHLVTHSMGSILARTVFATHTFARLGRVVMLGPPHGGSRVAANLARAVGWLCRPLSQLSDDPQSFVNQLPEPVHAEIGIIAAARDRVVRVENTRLAYQADHAIVDYGHTSMLFRKEVADLVESFLKQGRFAPSSVQSV